ncbi:MAG: TetR/AcrR family transcriptional regulator, partial [Acidimicrobiales bacterium]
MAVAPGSRRYEPDPVGSPRPAPPQNAPAVVRHLGADDRSSQRIRIVDATLACVATQGVSKTTLDDISEAAGLSRATVYRAFPGGRDAIFAATVETELARLFSHLAVSMGEAKDLEEVLVAGMVETARNL